ncbi:phenoloxidase 2-like, partial [Hetaerina americana]|uniref:phenoloxidase 2-like n=1 Tax=Hetaerina americana TaxID=62018 RepID=UPI003A7F1AF0
LTTVPDISLCQELDRNAKFSVFIPHHRRMARQLIEIFLGKKSFDEFICVAVYARDRVNPSLFVYAFFVAILHREDSKNIQLPPFHEMFPDSFVDGKTLNKAKLYASVLPEGKRPLLIIPKDFTANDLDIEHRLAYFREDLSLNLHHWHWHLVYPFDCPKEIFNKDRRGELFYYMHHQLIARYNIERLCNNLARVKRYFNFDEPIEEGYFPKMDKPFASRSWAARHAGSRLSDIRREEERNVFDIDDLKRWKDLIIDAIHLGRVIDKNGEIIKLDEKTGIDILGNIIEACPTLSKNYPLYGDLHNSGHLAIALCHDPDNRYLEDVSVMGVPSTAARDPVFYRWHTFIDYIFEMHKNTLPPYTAAELDYQGIRIKKVALTTGVSDQMLYTFWEMADMDLSNGLDFVPGGSVFAQFTRIQHNPFKYTIEVENSTGQPRKGTVRIFLAPKYDEKGRRLLFVDQKRLFIEMDKFTVSLGESPAITTIVRKSLDSNVTTNYETTFAKLETLTSDGMG